MDHKRLTSILFVMIIVMAFSFAAMIVGFILGLILLLSPDKSSMPMFIMSIIGSTIFNVLWIIFDRLYDKWEKMEKDKKEVEEDNDNEL